MAFAQIASTSFVMDYAHGARFITSWRPGATQRRLVRIFGVEETQAAPPMAAFRCRSCGFVEFYAGDEYAAE